MKGSLVFIVLVVAVVAATLQHINKSNPQGDRIEKMADGLKEVKKYLPPGSSFKFNMPEGAPGDAYMLWRYILAPAYASIHPKEQFDTVLSISNMNVSDSAIHALTDNRNVLCTSTDGQYKYYLTCKNK